MDREDQDQRLQCYTDGDLLFHLDLQGIAYIQAPSRGGAEALLFLCRQDAPAVHSLFQNAVPGLD